MTKNFEEFPVYLRSLDLIEKVYHFLEAKNFEKEFEFNNQIKRAGFSISNNIARFGI
ncbi:four helix bundle protein [Chryseobacterium defluvii]|uniref:Four helix bundle protein n=1 Tax=Chryseobacterium defluvii TaxID=160396 RepID=A0A495SBX0_9FLAO|nr:four helix bundle protein [Chryseobacterium defluvii]RKS96648.1 four helix bundle protein [Chryseobacterium defluvii]